MTRTPPAHAGVPLARMAAFALAALAMVAFGNLMFPMTTGQHVYLWAQGFPVLDPWKATAFGFDYATLGWAKRSLVGSVLGFGPAASAPGWQPGLALAMSWPSVVLALGLGAALARMQDLRLAAAMLVSPAIFMNFGYDLGRFDFINLCLVLAILLCGRRWAVLAAPVMILVHEAALVAHLPLLLALHYDRYRDAALAALALALSLAVLASLMLLASPPEPQALQALYPQALPSSLAVLTRPFAENLAMVRAVFDPFPWIHADSFVAGALYLALFAMATSGARRGALGPVLLVAALAPLALGSVGVDYGRWVALAVTNLAVILLIRAPQTSAPRALSLVLILSVLLGPMGIQFPFQIIL